MQIINGLLFDLSILAIDGEGVGDFDNHIMDTFSYDFGSDGSYEFQVVFDTQEYSVRVSDPTLYNMDKNLFGVVSNWIGEAFGDFSMVNSLLDINSGKVELRQMVQFLRATSSATINQDLSNNIFAQNTKGSYSTDINSMSKSQMVNDIKTTLRSGNAFLALTKLRQNLVLMSSINKFINKKMGVKMNLINVVDNLAGKMAILKFSKTDTEIRQDFGKMWESTIAGEMVASFLSDEGIRETFLKEDDIENDAFIFFEKMVKGEGTYIYDPSGDVFLNGLLISEDGGLYTTLAEVLSADNVAFVDPKKQQSSYKIFMMEDNIHKNPLDRFRDYLEFRNYFDEINTNAGFRLTAKMPFVDSNGKIDSYSVDLSENVLVPITITNPSTVPAYIQDTIKSSLISIKDIKKLDIWAWSLPQLKMEPSLSPAERTRVFRTRNIYETEEGPLKIPNESRLKIAYSNLKKHSLSTNNPIELMRKDFTAKQISIVTEVIAMQKITIKLHELLDDVTIPNEFADDLEVFEKYSSLIETLNFIYKYHPDLANQLSKIFLSENVLDTTTNGDDHWDTLAENELLLSNPSSIFNFFSDGKNFLQMSNFRANAYEVINSALKIAGYGIYLNANSGAPSTITSGSQYATSFLHIMDAYIHLNTPGSQQRNAIFMKDDRESDIKTGKTVILEQEMACIEDLLDNIAYLHGFSTLSENHQALLDYVCSKTVNHPDSLYPGFGDYMGYIFSVVDMRGLTRNVNINPSPFISMQASDVEWRYILQYSDAGTFIGWLDSDLHQIFPQLGYPMHIIQMESGKESLVLVPFGYLCDSNGVLSEIYPGQINTIDSTQIAPRTLFISDHTYFNILKTSIKMNIDYIKIFSDLKIDGTEFKDAGRSLMIGYHGVSTLTYALRKLVRIKSSQDIGGAFISVINTKIVKQNFESVMQGSSYSNFGSVFLDSQQGKIVEHILNNPDSYNEGFEQIIEEFTRKAHNLDFSAYASQEVKDYINAQETSNPGICLEIATSFGKTVDLSGNIVYGVNQYGQNLYQWWQNFKLSNNQNNPINSCPQNEYYDHVLMLKLSHFDEIRNFYYQINSGYTPNWIRYHPDPYFLSKWNQLGV